MHAPTRWLVGAVAFSVAVATSGRAQQASPVLPDLLNDVKQVHTKMVSLARAIPADKYGWRPGEGVRSVGEVFKHVISDNYLLPASLGTPAPAATGIKGDDYKTASAFEDRALDRDAIIAELEKSFAHLEGAMSAPGKAMTDRVKLFGAMDVTVQQAWVLTTTHVHEHLGQAIAYARTNGVVPPWSR